MKKIAIGSLSVALGMGASSLQAADAPAERGGYETVIVTARKRPEDAQSIPISVSAFTQADLDTLNVQTVNDLKYVAPSVYVAPTTFRQDTLNITIRGQRDFDSSSGQSVMSFDPAAAVYMDGVYLARPVGLATSLFDIDTFAVLKGPQGTLVGRNSTGGAILYQTREPTNQFEAYAKITAGDHGRGDFQGILNIPLSDDLAFRASFQVSDQKGYLHNFYRDPATGYTNKQPALGSNKIAANLSLKWQPDDTFKLLLRANISAEHDTGSSYHDLGYFVGTVPSSGKPSVCNLPGTCTGFTDLLGHVIAPYYTTVTSSTVSGINTDPVAYNSLINSIAREQTPAYGFWSVEQAVSNLDVGHYQTVSAVAEKKLDDNLSVKLLGAFRWWDNTGNSISRGLPYDVTAYRYQVPDYKSYQTELTLNGSNFDSQLIWTAGLFFFQEDSPNDGGYFWLFKPAGIAPAPTPALKQIVLMDGTDNDQTNTSYAAYAQATYSVLPDTRITAGVRYTYDERFAHLNTLDDIFPATSAAGYTNGVFDSTPVTLNGITYAGQVHVCALTDVNGVTKSPTNCPVDINKSYHKPTFTIALEHDLFDHTLIYATTRTGYRSGAINSAAVQPAVISAKPENLQDYEVGIKSDWDLMGMPVRTNLAGYFSDYHDIQVLVALPNVTLASAPGGGPCTQALFNTSSCLGTTTTDNVTLNAKTAHIFGTEWDLSLQPIPQLTLNVAGSWLGAVYTDFTFTPPAGYLLPVTSTNLSGTPFPLPRWQTNETVRYSTGLRDIVGIPVDDVALTAHYYWQSAYPAAPSAYINPVTRAGSFGMLNLRVDVPNLGGKGFDFAFYMNNALNTTACLPEYNGVLSTAPQGTATVVGSSGALQCVPLPPRMAGISLAYKF